MDFTDTLSLMVIGIGGYQRLIVADGLDLPLGGVGEMTGVHGGVFALVGLGGDADGIACIVIGIACDFITTFNTA